MHINFIHAGSPSIVSLSFNQQESSLVCVSTGGPATVVEWKRDNVSLAEDRNTDHNIISDYQQIQRVVNTETATYENKLISSNITNLIGTFTCTVSNIRGSAESSLTVDGMIIVVVWDYLYHGNVLNLIHTHVIEYFKIKTL